MKNNNKKEIYSFTTFIHHYRERNAFKELCQKYQTNPQSLTPLEKVLFAAAAEDHRFDYDGLLETVAPLKGVKTTSLINTSSECLLDTLPKDIIFEIAYFLTLKELLILTKTSKRYQQFINEYVTFNLDEVTTLPFDAAWEIVKKARTSDRYIQLDKKFHANPTSLRANELADYMLANDNLSKFIPHIRLLYNAITSLENKRESINTALSVQHAKSFNIIDSKVHSLKKSMYAIMLSHIRKEMNEIETSVSTLAEPAKSMTMKAKIINLNQTDIIKEFKSILQYVSNPLHKPEEDFELFTGKLKNVFQQDCISTDFGFINLAGLYVDLSLFFPLYNYNSFNMENTIIDSSQFDIHTKSIYKPIATGYVSQATYEYSFLLNKSILLAQITNTLFFTLNKQDSYNLYSNWSTIYEANHQQLSNDLDALMTLALQWDNNTKNGMYRARLGSIIANNFEQRVDGILKNKFQGITYKIDSLITAIDIMLKHPFFNKKSGKFLSLYREKDVQEYIDIIAASHKTLTACKQKLKEFEKHKKPGKK